MLALKFQGCGRKGEGKTMKINIKEDNLATTELEKMIKKLQTELLITRIMNGISIVLLIIVLVGGFVVYKSVVSFVTELQPVLAQVSEIDVSGFEQTMENLNEAVAEVDWEQVLSQLEEIDMDAVNSVLSGLNTGELTEAMENVNGVTGTLDELSDMFGSFSELFQ
ncbi:MAG: hypothetical protein IJF07_05590 [Lachnospiraceae bacterium]|nr:hypothetical protein [Lachnospiraceae bacterium]